MCDLSLLEEKARRARERISRLARNGIDWHRRSAETSLNILAALYGHWVPRGLLEGIERTVIISKGHCSLALYSWLVEMGVLDEEELWSFAAVGSRLQAHPEAFRIPGVVVSTGSLGQGLSVANGIALASKIDGVKREVAVLLGDGELNEGQVWEAIATASSLRLDNVLAVVDRNMRQHSGDTEAIKPLEPLGNKWEAFGWSVVEVEGCKVGDIVGGLKELEKLRGRPRALIVRTFTRHY